MIRTHFEDWFCPHSASNCLGAFKPIKRNSICFEYQEGKYTFEEYLASYPVLKLRMKDI